MKKIISIFLTFGMLVSISGCSSAQAVLSAQAAVEPIPAEELAAETAAEASAKTGQTSAGEAAAETEQMPAVVNGDMLETRQGRYDLNLYLTNFAETYLPDPALKEMELDTENVDVTAFLNYAFWYNEHTVDAVKNLYAGKHDKEDHDDGYTLDELNATLEELFGITISEADAEKYEDDPDGDWPAVYEDGRLKVRLAPEIYLPHYAIAQDVTEIDDDHLEVTFYSYVITMEEYELTYHGPYTGLYLWKTVTEADRSTLLDRAAKGTVRLRRDGDGYQAEYLRLDYDVHDVEFRKLFIFYDATTGHAEYTYRPYGTIYSPDIVYKTEEYGSEFPKWLEGEHFDLILRPGEEVPEDEYKTDHAQLEGALVRGLNRDGSTAWEKVFYARNTVGQFNSISDIGMSGDTYYFGNSGNLIALDVNTGEVLWENADIGMGDDSSVIDGKGSVYVLGPDSPDICVVDRDGETLFCKGQFYEEYYWPYLLEFDEENHTMYIGLDGGEEDEYTVMIAKYGSKGHVVKFDTKTFEYELDTSYRKPMTLEEAQELDRIHEIHSTYITASSTLEAGSGLYEPENVMDGREDTAWVEGVDGLGEGEYLDFEFPSGARVLYVEIVNGYAKDEETFRRNAAPSRIRLMSGGTEVILEPDTYYGGRTFYVLPEELPIYISVRLKIEAVSEGSSYEDTCISEVKFWGVLP